MKRNILVVGLLVVAVLVGVMFLGRSTKSAMPSETEITVKSALTAPENMYDFGEIRMKDGKVAHLFKITNPTDKNLTAEYLSTSCMCTTAYIVDDKQSGPFGIGGHEFERQSENAVQAGRKQGDQGRLDPNAHGPAGVGPVQRYVTLTDSTAGKLQLEIKGLVKP